MAKSDKLYKDSPKLERDEESGEMGVKKPSKADGQDMGTEGNPLPGSSGEMPVHAAERREVKNKHVTEHLAMHSRHENEHETHKGDKKELHKKHEAELEDMHGRHEEEIKAMHKRHEKSGGSKETVDTAPKE